MVEYKPTMANRRPQILLTETVPSEAENALCNMIREPAIRAGFTPEAAEVASRVIYRSNATDALGLSTLLYTQLRDDLEFGTVAFPICESQPLRTYFEEIGSDAFTGMTLFQDQIVQKLSTDRTGLTSYDGSPEFSMGIVVRTQNGRIELIDRGSGPAWERYPILTDDGQAFLIAINQHLLVPASSPSQNSIYGATIVFRNYREGHWAPESLTIHVPNVLDSENLKVSFLLTGSINQHARIKVKHHLEGGYFTESDQTMDVELAGIYTPPSFGAIPFPTSVNPDKRHFAVPKKNGLPVTIEQDQMSKTMQSYFRSPEQRYRLQERVTLAETIASAQLTINDNEEASTLRIHTAGGQLPPIANPRALLEAGTGNYKLLSMIMRDLLGTSREQGRGQYGLWEMLQDLLNEPDTQELLRQEPDHIQRFQHRHDPPPESGKKKGRPPKKKLEEG